MKRLMNVSYQVDDEFQSLQSDGRGMRCVRQDADLFFYRRYRRFFVRRYRRFFYRRVRFYRRFFYRRFRFF
mgnify:CR=1 FL=1